MDGWWSTYVHGIFEVERVGTAWKEGRERKRTSSRKSEFTAVWFGVNDARNISYASKYDFIYKVHEKRVKISLAYKFISQDSIRSGSDSYIGY